MSNDAATDATERHDASPAAAPSADATETPEQTARLELLAEENRRLRAEYARARQSRYRRTAIGLAAIGLGALAGGLLFPGTREVFVALGATGLFGGLLTYYLTPEQFVAASVGERVYAASAANGAALVAELGLSDRRVYLPGTDSAGATLYVPQHTAFDVPESREGPFVHESSERGLLLEPTGAGLFDEFERALTGDLASTPGPLARQLCDALVEQFELAAGADPDVDPADDRVTVAIAESAFGAVDRFDHPIGSFLAVGLARGLDAPVELEVDAGDDRAAWLVTCRIDPESEPATEFEWVG